jgi:hypothetical protein
MKKNIHIVGLLFLSVFLFDYSIVYAASSYYVDNSVVSNGNGTQASPWKNFSNINWTTISGASKPCTIYVSGGVTSQTYSEELTVGASGSSSTWPYTGTPTGEIIIKRPSESEWSNHSGAVYIRASAGGSINVDNISNIVIDGFDFSNTRNSAGSPGIHAFYCNHIVIRNCTSSTNQGKTFLPYQANYITFQNNNLGPNSTYYGDDLLGIDGSHYMIENNIIHSAPSTGGGAHADCVHFGDPGDDFTFRYNVFRVTETAFMIYLEPSGGAITNVKIYGNVFESYDPKGNNSFSAIDMDGDLGGSNNYSTSWIYNNTFINCNNNSSGGAYWGAIAYRPNSTHPSHRIYIKNNVFYNSRVTLEGPNTSGQIAVMDYNVYYTDGVQDSYVIQYGSSQYSTAAAFHAAHSAYEANGKTGNPNLASVSNASEGTTSHDPRPTSNSTLLIGMGDSSLGSTYQNGLSMSTGKSSWPLSVSLTPRGAAWSIGAYQYESGTTVVAPSNLRTQ